MSDYISKQEAIQKVTEVELQDGTFADAKIKIGAIKTLNEKEIIRKTVERIVERVENARQKYQRLVKEQGEKEDEAMNIHFRGVMNIVKEEGGIE